MADTKSTGRNGRGPEGAFIANLAFRTTNLKGTTMRRRIARNFRFLWGKRSYTLREISRLLQINIRTAQTWHREGLTPIDPNDRPMLFLGSDIRQFLIARRDSRKIKLQPDQFYCPRCKTARNSDPEKVFYQPTGRKMGRCDEQVFIKGICLICGCRLTRFTTKSKCRIPFGTVHSKQADIGLYGDCHHRLNTDNENGGQ